LVSLFLPAGRTRGEPGSFAVAGPDERPCLRDPQDDELQARGGEERAMGTASGDTRERPQLITVAALAESHAALRSAGYRVIGPTVRDGAIVLAELSSAADLPHGWALRWNLVATGCGGAAMARPFAAPWAPAPPRGQASTSL